MDDKNRDIQKHDGLEKKPTHKETDENFHQYTEARNINQVKKGVIMAKEGLEKEAYEIGSKVRDDVERGKEYAEDSIASLEEKVKSHPLMSVGLSFLLGVVISTFMRPK